MKNIFILKLQITENQSTLDVSENSKIAYNFIQYELREGNVMSIKVELDVKLLKSATKRIMLKGTC